MKIHCIQCNEPSVVYKTDVDIIENFYGRMFRFVPTKPIDTCETCGSYSLSFETLRFMEFHMSMEALWTGNISGETFKSIRKSLGFTRMRMAAFIGNWTTEKDIEAWELLTTLVPLSSSLEAKLLKAVVEARLEASKNSEVRPAE